MSWNINGVKNKLENNQVQNFMLDYDIVCLNETKTDQKFDLPVYQTYLSRGDNRHRGGCAVLVKSYLNKMLCHMNWNNADLVVFKFQFIPITFIAAYIPRHDSPYFSDDIIASVNGICSKVRDIMSFLVILTRDIRTYVNI